MKLLLYTVGLELKKCQPNLFPTYQCLPMFNLCREKLKINAVSGQLDETFNDMLNKY